MRRFRRGGGSPSDPTSSSLDEGSRLPDVETGAVTRRLALGAAALSTYAVVRATAPSDPASLPREPRSSPRGLEIVDSDYDSLEEALDVTPVGGVLEVWDTHARSTPFIIDKPVTVRFRGTAEISIDSPSAAAIILAADRIRLEDPVLVGTGGNRAGKGDGIRGTGTAAEPLTGVQIVRPRIREFSMSGIYLENVFGFLIEDVDIRRCGYGGVLLLSAINGSVLRGTIKDILQPSGFVNSYGIAVTRRASADIEDSAPRSRDVTVESVTVDGVLKWEGLDTHAGENIVFRGNSVYRALRGIAVVGSKGVANGPPGTIYAPLNCVVVDNVVSFCKTDGTGERGIVFAGASDAPGDMREFATGRISGNVISDYGTENSPNGAALQIYGTVGVSVNDNLVINPGYSGIDINHDNRGAKLIGNTIIDVWSDRQPTCTAVKLHSINNRVSISGTTIVRMSKSAALVNDNGLSVAPSPSNIVLDGGGNDWGAAETAVVDQGLEAQGGSSAVRVSFHGADPAEQAPAISSPAENVTGLKKAVDAIRTVLSGVGLTE